MSKKTPIPPFGIPRPTDEPRKYALDTNALIALEHWVISSLDDRDGSKLDAKIQGATVYYSTVARDEFLQRGTLADFILLVAKYGMLETSSAPQWVIDDVTLQYTGRGKSLTPHRLNDIQIVADAIAAGATLLTRDEEILTIFPPPLSESW